MKKHWRPKKKRRTLSFEMCEGRVLLAGVVSDDFAGTELGNDWQFINPLGDGAADVGDGVVEISVPGGADHDVWTTGNMAPRIVQTIDDDDFEVEIKLDTLPLGAYATGGIVIEARADRFLRFDYSSSGSSLKAFAASIDGASAVVHYNGAIASQTPMYMRVQRAGDDWSQLVSSDGVSWQTTTMFTEEIAPDTLGIFAGNYGASTAPQFTLAVDYLHNVSSETVTVSPRSTNNHSPELTGQISHSQATVDVTVSGSTYSATNQGDGSWRLASGVIAPPLVDGVYDVSATASFDGQQWSDTTVDELTIDATPPVVTATPITTGETSPALHGSVDDPSASVQLQVDGANYPAVNQGDGSWSLTPGVLSNLSDGVYDIVVQATDALGNVGFDATTDELTIDTSIPVVTVDSMTTKDVTPPLSGSVNDPQANIEVQIGPEVYSAVNLGNGLWKLDDDEITVSLSEGVYDLVIHATAADEKVGVDSTIDELVIDLTAPVIGLNEITTSDTTPDLSGNIDDAEATIQLTVEGNVYQPVNLGNGAWSLSGDELIAELSLGIHTVDLSATDVVGNTFQTSGTIEIVADSQSPILNVWYGEQQSFGHIGLAQPWVNILGNVADPDGVASLTYSLNGGEDRPLTIGADGRRLQAPGDFNIDLNQSELVEGANTVLITATDNLGHEAFMTVNVQFTRLNQWPEEYTADWSSATKIEDVAQVVDGAWELTPSGVRTTEIGYDRIIALGNLQSTQYEVEVPVTIHSWAPSLQPIVGLVGRWQGHVDLDESQPHWQWWPLGAIAGYQHRFGDNDLRLIGWVDQPGNPIAETPYEINHGVTYVFKMQVVSNPGDTATYRLKVWEQGTTEPGAWSIVGQGVEGEPSSGAVGLLAHYSDVTFGNVSIRPIVDADPPTLSNVSASAGDDSIVVTATTDESSKLSVRYGLTQQYELGVVNEANFATQHSVNLEGLDSGTKYYLEVTAIDAAGNVSQPQQLAATTTQPDVTPPSVSQLNVSVYPNLTIVTAATDESAVLDVVYGTTPEEVAGSVSGATYALSHELYVQGLDPDTTYYLRVSATDVSGNTSAEQLVQITTPPPDTQTPEFQLVTAESTADEIQIDGDNDELTTWEVLYGLTPQYEIGSIEDTSYASTHSVVIGGLAQETTYYLRAIASDTSGNQSTYDLIVQTEALRIPVSDHFNAPQLDPVWTFVDPLGDASLTLTGNQAEISLPAGISHEIWTDGVHAPRLMQEVSNLDFEVELKFVKPPSGSIAINGLYVEDDQQNFLRFEFYSNGGQVKLYAATFASGTVITRTNQTISAGADDPLWMRVARTGDQWLLQYSTDGSQWTVGAAFNHQLDVQGMGVSAGNSGGGTAPAYTSLIDYFFNTASPVADTSSPVVSNVSTDASVTQITLTGDTDEQSLWEAQYGLTPSYELGSVFGPLGTSHEVSIDNLESGTTYYVRLIARDESGNETPPHDFEITTDVPDVTPPEISNVAANPSNESIRITGDTNEPTTWDVHYGETPEYELGVVSSSSLAVSHDVLIEGLQTNTTYYLRIIARDESGNETVYDLEAATESTQLLASDHFNGLVLEDSIWTFVNPLGDASYSLTGNHVVISVPAGASHEGGNAPRLIQAISDLDFEAEVKFLHPPTGSIAMNGFLVESAIGDFMRVDMYSSAGQVKLYAASVVGSSTTTLAHQTIGALPDSPLWMRLTRSGDSWTVVYSTDGQNWQSGATYHHALEVSGVGISAGNYSSGSAPAYTSEVDYFFNTASPATDIAPPTISNLEATPAPNSITVTGLTDEASIWEVQYGLTTEFELGTMSESSMATSHSVVLEGLDSNQTYHVRVIAEDGVGNRSAPLDLVVTTTGTPAPSNRLASDSFNQQSIDFDVWEFVDPTGDGSVSADGSEANISIAGGSDHDIWSNGVNAARLMQSTDDIDFEVEVKFDNVPVGQYATTGILVEGPNNSFLRFEFYSDGANIRVFAARIVGGSATVLYHQTIAVGGGPLYMRVGREGSTWTQQYSTDGSAWQSAAAFDTQFEVSLVGFYAGNAGGASAPENSTSVDYFRVL